MLKRKLIGTSAAALLLMTGLVARAAAPQLPANAIGSDTTVVIHLDGSTLTPDNLRQAAQAVLGPNNMQQANEQIAKYQEKYDQAMKAGVQSVTMIAATREAPGANQGAPREQNQGVVYVQFKPGADTKSVENMIRDSMAPDEQQKAQFNREGNFLVVSQKGQKKPAQGDPARAKQFTEALNHIGNAAITVAFVPDQAIRDQAKQQGNDQNVPPPAKEAMNIVANSHWATVAVNLGNAPTITATDNAADADSAKKLVASINQGLATMKQAAQNLQNGQGGNNPMMMMFAPMLAPLADALKPAQNGNHVTVTLKGPALAMVGQTVMSFAPMIGGMRGGPGGPPRGASTAPRGNRQYPPPGGP